MKTKQNSLKTAGGFTLMEMLATVVVMGTLASLAVTGIRFANKGSANVKLETQVRQLNAAASVYLASGGSLQGIGDVNSALAKLKTVASAGTRNQLAGFRGRVVDAGLFAVMQSETEADGDAPRAVWSADTLRFEIVHSGSGVKSFEISDVLAAATPEEEERSASLLLASNDGWVWDYQDFGSKAVGKIDVEVEADLGAKGVDSPYGEVLRLNPPRFSVPAGSYEYGKFNLPVYLIDENPIASSRIFYTTDERTWREYDGSAIIVTPNSRLVAYSAANDPEHWMDSGRDSAFYRSTFTITGNAEGTFSNATGGPNMVVGGSGSRFTWGKPSGTIDPSWMLYNGASFLDVNPDERFLLGEISYYNGTIASGTGAVSVALDIALSFGGTSGANGFQYSLNLINTPNLTGNTADQSADYVHFGDVRSEVPMTLGGTDYTLVLEFGETTANGFSTIDQFFVHEDRTATGRLYGTLIRVVEEEDSVEGLSAN